jgi:hypothetical protein
MRIAALVLGIIGAVLGIFAALLALSVGGIGQATGAEGGALVTALGWWSLAFVFLGFVGSGLALARPKLAGALLLVAGVGFFISISFFAIISGPLFLLAAMFAFMGSGRRRVDDARAPA